MIYEANPAAVQSAASSFILDWKGLARPAGTRREARIGWYSPPTALKRRQFRRHIAGADEKCGADR